MIADMKQQLQHQEEEMVQVYWQHNNAIA
jgi:hypothetical protein